MTSNILITDESLPPCPYRMIKMNWSSCRVALGKLKFSYFSAGMMAPARLFGWMSLHRNYQNTEEHFTRIAD